MSDTNVHFNKAHQNIMNLLYVLLASGAVLFWLGSLPILASLFLGIGIPLYFAYIFMPKFPMVSTIILSLLIIIQLVELDVVALDIINSLRIDSLDYISLLMANFQLWFFGITCFALLNTIKGMQLKESQKVDYNLLDEEDN